jgi:hypothetical protein
MTDSAFWRQLEAQNDESKVRIAIASGHYNPNDAAVAQDWLKRKEEARSAAASSKRDSREEETLAIAKEANKIASRAERWAMYAAIAAVIALIISIVRSQN